tara:strand:+ start:2111 stop:2761 length:651 start_codon:yes stop_codon:yes gene_type:complete
MSNIILEVKNLSHSYTSDVLSVDNVNIEIHEGEKVSIRGPSGCGKSSLLRLIAGLEIPKLGQIKLDGVIVSNKDHVLPPEKRKVGLVVQEKALFPHLTVSENICFGIKKEKNENQILKEMLELFRIQELANKYPHEISGGEQQRVAVARSMAPDPKFLMLDEPFSALDKELKNSLYVDISDIFSTKNSTILLVTHDEKEAEIMTNRHLKMLNGKLL